MALLSAVAGFSQKIPIREPRLLPLPAVSGGLAYFSLIPTQNMQLASGSNGWTKADTLRGIGTALDIELLRYRWGSLILNPAQYDAYASLAYAIFSHIGSFDLPSDYASAFELGKVPVSGFAMNLLVKELYLDNHFVYKYSRRGNLHGNLGIGFTTLSSYKNGSGVRILESNGLGLHFGIGWQVTLLGRPGERLRLGVDLGYSLRSFNFGEQPELKLSGETGGTISPIESIALNTPELKLSLEFGERLFAAYTPYRDPYKLGLLNLSSGIGFIKFQQGTRIQYDSSGVSLSIPITARISQNYDLQIFKYNWPFHFIRQANIDGFSGLGVRYWRNSSSTKLPAGWARQITDGSRSYSGMSFAPRVIDIYLEHEIIYPLGRRFHWKVSAGTGYANISLYQNIKLEKLIRSSGLTWQFGGGLDYTFQGDGSSMVVIGLSAAYYHQAFNFDLDNTDIRSANAGEIIPITYLDLSQPVISLDIGLIFGGNSNSAQRVHEEFINKNFTKALEIQTELLNSFPDHHNRETLLIEKQMIEDTLVARYYQDANQVLNEGKLKSAYSLVSRGQAPPTKSLEKAVGGMKIKISYRALEAAAEALKNIDYEYAEEMILLALKSDPSSIKVAKVLLARSYILRATILYQSRTYARALYWLKQADGLTDRYKLVTEDLRQKIGEGRLDDANEGILREDKEMVYQSMQDAKALKPVLGKIVDEHLKQLEEAIEFETDQHVGSLKRMALDNLLDDISELDPENFIPKVGMQGSVLSNYVGAPERRFKEGEYELWTYPRVNGQELWLYLRDGIIEKVELKQ